MMKFYCVLTEFEGDYCWQDGEPEPEVAVAQFRGTWDGDSNHLETISGSIPVGKVVPFLGWPQVAV